MDRRSSTGAPRFRAGEDQASVSSFLTSIVLLTGVFGGLVIVVTVILVCRYCQGQQKPERGLTYRVARRDNSSERNSRYDAITSDISEPSTWSVPGTALTPRATVHFRYPERVSDPDFATETTRLKSDYEKDDYTDDSQVRVQNLAQMEVPGPVSVTSQTKCSPHISEAPRRVSFQQENFPFSTWSGDFQSRRFNDTDYHNSRALKTGRSLLRQFSMDGASAIVQGRGQLDDPHLRFSSLDERLTISGNPRRELVLDGQTGEHHGSHHRQFLYHQQSPAHDPSSAAAERESSPRHGRDVVEDHLRQSRDKNDLPSPSFRSARISSTPQTQSLTLSREGSRPSPSPPARQLQESPPSTTASSHSRRAEEVNNPLSSPFRPIKNLARQSFSAHRPIRAQVSVEVHQQLLPHDSSNNNSEESRLRALGHQDKLRAQVERLSYLHPHSPKIDALGRAVYFQSLDSPRANVYRSSRKVRSYDDYLEDYDALKITEFSKGPFYNADYDVVSELSSPTSSKVRYNDTGSLEQLNEDTIEEFVDVTTVEGRRELDIAEDTEDSAETINGNRKYRALWRLRATLEEEEECSDTVRMEDMTSPDDSPDREHVTPNTTSFESSAQSDPCPSDHRDSGIQFEMSASKAHSHVNFLHPNYENRRQNFRNVGNRFQKGNHSTSVENSFDSVETDGEVSDTSRYEVTTTSFESSTTTDNTDSTNESQASKLRQMKADSGYKSLETQQQCSRELGDHEVTKWDFRASVECGEGIAARRDRRTSVEREVIGGYHGTLASGAEVTVGAHTSEGSRQDISWQQRSDSLWRPSAAHSYFDRRTAKTASKKRREYSRDRPQVVHVYESTQEVENEPKSDLHSCEKFPENTLPSKISVFARFFKSHPRSQRERYLVRDYSIDKKTNSIFNEFVRQEIPPTARKSTDLPYSARLPIGNRHKLQRKRTEPALLGDEHTPRRDRLIPSMRSSSLGSESSACSRKLSPRDSIEEKDDEVDEEVMMHSHRLPLWASARLEEASSVQLQTQKLSLHEIPVIKLCPEEFQAL